MKQLIFVDNESGENTAEEMRSAQRYLSLHDLDDSYLESMQSVENFSDLDRDIQLETIFNPNNAILSFSMFTANHYGSLYQLRDLLEAAGRYEVKGLIYISTSSKLQTALNDIFEMNKYNPTLVMFAIENNYIIEKSDYDGKHNGDLVRLRVNFAGTEIGKFIIEERIDLPNLLAN